MQSDKIGSGRRLSDDNAQRVTLPESRAKLFNRYEVEKKAAEQKKKALEKKKKQEKLDRLSYVYAGARLGGARAPEDRELNRQLAVTSLQQKYNEKTTNALSEEAERKKQEELKKKHKEKVDLLNLLYARCTLGDVISAGGQGASSQQSLSNMEQRSGVGEGTSNGRKRKLVEQSSPEDLRAQMVYVGEEGLFANRAYGRELSPDEVPPVPANSPISAGYLDPSSMHSLLTPEEREQLHKERMRAAREKMQEKYNSLSHPGDGSAQ